MRALCFLIAFGSLSLFVLFAVNLFERSWVSAIYYYIVGSAFSFSLMWLDKKYHPRERLTLVTNRV